MGGNEVSRLKRAREAHGLSQGELAARAEISRQALNAIEAGVYQPGVQAAIKIARELGLSVEQLFGPEEDQQVSAGWIGEAEPRAGSHVVLARIGGKLIALNQPLADLRLAPAFGVVAHASHRRVAVRALRTREEIDSTLVIAGCDPAVTILSDWLRRHRLPVTIAAITRSSRAALTAVLRNQVHMAGVHLRDPRSGAYNVLPSSRNSGERKPVLINFARWELGIATAPGNPLSIRGWDDLGRPHLRIVNREAGAGARMALDEALTQRKIQSHAIDGYRREVDGHLAVAAAIAAKEADLGVTIGVAADAYGLGFVPIREERYDLVIPESAMSLAPVRIVIDTLNSQRFGRELSTLCGYNTSETGQVRAAG
ncbi:MAG: helix-turn-helix domain-containing protein [Candidatus Binataceae bacterium]|nr:helix-turn-helix domain-containing protein [Candidatus Binataceae bacterium]